MRLLDNVTKALITSRSYAWMSAMASPQRVIRVALVAGHGRCSPRPDARPSAWTCAGRTTAARPCRATMGAASTAEVHSIPDMPANASDELGPTCVNVRKCITSLLTSECQRKPTSVGFPRLGLCWGAGRSAAPPSVDEGWPTRWAIAEAVRMYQAGEYPEATGIAKRMLAIGGKALEHFSCPRCLLPRAGREATALSALSPRGANRRSRRGAGAGPTAANARHSAGARSRSGCRPRGPRSGRPKTSVRRDSAGSRSR